MARDFSQVSRKRPKQHHRESTKHRCNDQESLSLFGQVDSYDEGEKHSRLFNDHTPSQDQSHCHGADEQQQGASLGRLRAHELTVCDAHQQGQTVNWEQDAIEQLCHQNHRYSWQVGDDRCHRYQDSAEGDAPEGPPRYLWQGPTLYVLGREHQALCCRNDPQNHREHRAQRRGHKTQREGKGAYFAKVMLDGIGQQTDVELS
mmetsp:Transcript_27619/g.60146  ORF Transcript_27619/g.60146 Transcript_27619/m.60146 type:complete len:203 (-) Transcript_27619:854-1462(-)